VGGIKTSKDVQDVFDSGQHWSNWKYCCKEQGRVSKMAAAYGTDNCILGADVKE